MTLFLIFILLKCSIIYSSQSPHNWIDPHEIVTTDTNFFNPEQQKCLCSSTSAEDKLTLIHYKRVINLLLNSITITGDYSNYSGRLTIEMSVSAYDYLKNFAKSPDDDVASLRKVDGILTNTFTKSPQEHLFDSVVSWTDQLYFNFYNRTTGMLLVLLFMCIISYKLLRANFNIWTVIGYLIFIGWIVDFAFTWMKLYQEAEINKMADSLRYNSVPPNCDPSKMSIWSYIWSSLSSDTECRNYHHIMYKDHFWNLGPLTVISHQVGIVILTPASSIGKALGSFSVAILDVLPFYAKIVVFPLLLIFAAILICIILSFMTNTSFGFNLLHVIQFNFGSRERRAISDSLSGENLRHLLGVIHRNAIENVETQNVNLNGDSCKSCQTKLKEGQIAGPPDLKSITNENGKDSDGSLNNKKCRPQNVCDVQLTDSEKEKDNETDDKLEASTENIYKSKASKSAEVSENIENIESCADYSVNKEDSKT